jgi:DNA-binding CsgD family transcriptional regulator
MAGVTHHAALRRLVNLLEASRTDHGSLTLVRGGIASGKSQLLSKFSRRAVESGAIALTASASRDEQLVPGGVVEQLFRSGEVPSHIRDRVKTLAAIAVTDLETDGPGRGDVLQAAASLVREIGTTILDLSVDHLITVIVDDIHHSDRLSVQLLLHLQRRVRFSRLMIVLSEWKRPQPTSPDFDADITRIPHHQLELAPLQQGEIRELLAQRTGHAAAPGLASLLEHLSGGNPMLVNALIEDHLAGGEDHFLESPEFSKAILICLHRWDSRLLEVARGLALLGGHANPQLLSRLLDIPPACAQQAIDILDDAGLISRYRFRHPTAPAVVLETLATKERSTVHARTAELLHHCCPEATVAEVADHLVTAGFVTSGWPVAVLRAAAEQSLNNGDVNLAVRYLELALTAAADHEGWPVTVSLSRAAWRLNPSAADVYYDELKAGLLPHRLGQRDMALLVRMAVWRGDRQTAAAALRMLDPSDELAYSRVTAELRLLFLWLYGSHHGRFAELVSCPDPDTEPGSHWALASQLLTESRTGTDTDLESHAEHLLANFHLEDSTVDVLASAVTALTYSHRIGRAATWCDKLISDAEDRGARTWQALFTGLRGDIALRDGCAGEAADYAHQAMTLLPEQGWGVMVGLPLSTLLLASTVLGDREATAAVLRRVVPDAMFATMIGLRYLQARGQHNLASGRILAAITDFQTCSTLMSAWELTTPPPLPLGNEFSQAQLRLARLARVGNLRQRHPDQVAMTDAQVRRLQLRTLVAGAPPGERCELLIQAVECMEVAGGDVELDQALTSLRQVLIDLGKVRPGPGMETSHQPGAAQCRATSPIARERRPLRLVTDGPREVPSDKRESVLSDAELNVAALAAQGQTNREIGQQLWITVSTVEQHLTRVYRKLGITGRSELPLHLRARSAR